MPWAVNPNMVFEAVPAAVPFCLLPVFWAVRRCLQGSPPWVRRTGIAGRLAGVVFLYA